jgi:arginyl-tRNA synthetase
MINPLYEEVNKLLENISITSNFYIKPIKKLEFGDFFSNILLINKENSKNIFENLEKNLEKGNELIDKITNLNGYLNIKVKDIFFQKTLVDYFLGCFNYENKILKKNDFKKNIDNIINIEIGSVNPTGEMHLAHGRNLVIGHSIYKLLKKYNHIVIREYYVNDGGKQMESFVESVWLFITDNSHMAQYKCSLVQLISIDLKELFIIDKDKTLEFFTKKYKDFILEKVLDNHRKSLKEFNFHYDYFIYETSVYPLRDKIMDLFCKKGVIFKQDSIGDDCDDKKHDLSKNLIKIHEWNSVIQGRIVINLKDELSPDFKVLRRNDFSWTYFANDLCYHWLKINRGVSKLILILGEDHSGYINNLIDAIHFIKEDIEMICITFGMVHLKDNEGNMKKLSKREGNIITINKLGEEIGINSLKFLLSMYEKKSVMEINIDYLKDQWSNDPLTYINYCYSRICSVEKLFFKTHGDILNSYVDSKEFSDMFIDNIFFIEQSERDIVVFMSFFLMLQKMH